MAETSGAQGAPTMSAFARIKAIAGGSAGNLVEWYDWFAYSSFALYFSKVFFPQGDQTAQLLQTAAIFAVGFLMRPIGAWLMGLYADRVGRRAALTLSVALMSAGSFAIALIPGYATIGVAAPILLTAARLVQGLSLGGEYGASATYMSEMAGKQRRGFWSSFQFVTLIAGQLTALVVLIVLQNTLSKEALEDWGWRVPFVIGGLLAVVVFWLRSGLEETQSYAKVQEAGGSKATTFGLFREHPTEALMIMALTGAGSLTFYALTTYMQKFLVNTSGFTKDTATQITAASLVIYMCVQPLYGMLGDRIGRTRLISFAFLGIAILAFPIMSMIAATDSAWVAFGLITLGLMFLSGYTAVNAVVKAELFPAHVRALGVALPYALANAVFGGSAEYVALWFKNAGTENYFYIYVSVGAAIACLVAIRMRDTGKTSLIEDD